METNHEAFKERLSHLKISQVELCRLIHVETSTVHRWIKGKRKIPGLVWAYLEKWEEAKNLKDRLRKVGISEFSENNCVGIDKWT